MNSRKDRLFLRGALFLVILLSASGVSFAQELFNSYITVNKTSFDEPVWVEFHGEYSLKNKVQIKAVIKDLEGVLSKDLIYKIKEETDQEGNISFGKLDEMGIQTKIDLNTLDISLQVHKEDKRLTEVFVSGGRKWRKSDVAVPSSLLSGYLNLRAGGELSGSNREDVLVDRYKDSSSLSAKAVLNISGVALESHYLYTDNASLISSTNPRRWGRLYSRIVFDDVKRTTRYTLGDLNHDVRGFQELILGSGFSFNKEFSIKPNFFRSSFKEYKFFLDSASLVEIFVNGRLVKKGSYPGGPVNLSDFPFNSGENEVQIKITDAVGESRILDFSDINDSRLLPFGVTDYSFNILYPRKNDSLELGISESYDNDNMTFTGFFHIGAYENLVLGTDLQYNKGHQLLGFEGLYGHELGLLKMNIAGTSDRATSKNGLGLRLEHESLFFRKGALSSFRMFSALEHRTKDFSHFLQGPTNSKYKIRFSVGQNFKNSIRASLGVVKDWFYMNRENQTYLTSNFGWTMYKNFEFAANMRVNLNNNDDTTVLLSLNWQSLKNNQQLTSTYDPIDNIASAELISYPMGGRQNFRTHVGGVVNESAKRSTAGLDYFNQRFEARVAHTSSFLNSGGTENATRLNLGVGLAFAGTAVAITKPVQNSFALISMKGLPFGYSVPINKGMYSQRGEVNLFGPAAITNLTPYYSDRASLDISSLPYGYSLKDEEFRFKTSYSRGVHIRALVDGETSVAGRLVFEDGKSAEYITGTLYKTVNGKRGAAVQQVFTGEDGVFSIERVENIKYILSFGTEEVTFKDINIFIKSKIGVYELKKDLVLRR